MRMKVTYLHDVHDGERLLQQGVGVEDFGGRSLHATRSNLGMMTFDFFSCSSSSTSSASNSSTLSGIGEW